MKHTATVLVVPLLFSLHYVSGNMISCSSSGSVVEGHSAAVTCHYPTNIELNKIDVYVYVYSSSEGDPDVAAICDWENDVLSCEMLPGYKVQIYGNTVILNITSAQKFHGGTYSCRVLQHKIDVSAEDCKLNVQDTLDNVSTQKPVSSESHMHCNAQRHHLSGQLSTITCVVPEILNPNIITVERREQPKSTKTVEILRCSKEDDSCVLNIFGHKIRRKQNSLDGFRVIVAMVDRPGLYMCKAEGSVTQSCMVEIYQELQKVAAEGSSQQLIQAPIYVALGLSFLLFVAAVIVSVFTFRHLRRHKKQETVFKTETSGHMELQEVSQPLTEASQESVTMGSVCTSGPDKAVIE